MTRSYDPIAEEFAIDSLYRRATAAQWNSDQDIDWPAMRLGDLPHATKTAMAAVYTYIHCAEALGVRQCGRLLDASPTDSVRRFISTQIADEMRHVRFFTRVVELLDTSADVSDRLLAFGENCNSVDGFADLLLRIQVVETAAQALFVETVKQSRQLMSRTIRLPGRGGVEILLAHISGLVGRDEARHVAFGMRYLTAHMAQLDCAARVSLSASVRRCATELLRSFAELRTVSLLLHIPMTALLDRVWQLQQRQFIGAGIDIGTIPDEFIDRTS